MAEEDDLGGILLDDPAAVLGLYYHLVGVPSDRKLRLFAVACARNLRRYWMDQRADWKDFDSAILGAEGFADGELDLLPHGWGYWVCDPEATHAARQASQRFGAMDDTGKMLRGKACSLVAEVLGPLGPLPTSVPEKVKDANDGAARRLAGVIYKEKKWDLCPLLADALEEGGLDYPDLVGHLRSEKVVHVRGCWAVDCVLGRE